MLNSAIIVGLILIVGYLLGEAVSRLRFPKVTGYILAGILLNPQILPWIPAYFPDKTEPITNLCLAFITFEVGTSLKWEKMKAMGKGMLTITVMESSFAFLAVLLFFTLAGYLGWLPFSDMMLVLPFAMLLASMAAPTDPSATVAVVHEFQAKGKVTDTIMGVAAFDDVFGIVFFSFALAFAGAIGGHETAGVGVQILSVAVDIVIPLVIGVVMGALFNLLDIWVLNEEESFYIILILGFQALSFGVARWLGTDELLSSLALGVTVANMNGNELKIRLVLQRYTESLIFVIFFVIGAMHLSFSTLAHSLVWVILFVLLRAGGKFLGTYVGGSIAKVPPKVKRYVAGGLVPQGGIVIGLALMIQHMKALHGLAGILISIVMGATIFHEIIGPFLSLLSLKKAGEIKSS